MKYYNYEDLGIENAKVPQNTHLFIESANGDLYLVDSTDNKDVLTSKNKGSTWTDITSVDDNDRNKISFWYDRDNNRLYYATSINQQDVGCSYFDLSDDSRVWVHGMDDLVNVYTGYDVLKPNGTVYLVYACDYKDGGGMDGNTSIEFYTGLQWTTNMGVTGARTHKMSFSVVIGGYAWFLWKWSDENVELWKHELGTHNFTEMEDCGANTELSDTKNQWGIAYDGSDVLYFVLKDTSDSKTYLYSYIISTDTLTKLGVYNIAIMLNRNTASGVMEKAFHLTEDKIFQLHPYAKHQLYFIAKLGTDKTIRGITDNFVITDV